MNANLDLGRWRLKRSEKNLQRRASFRSAKISVEVIFGICTKRREPPTGGARTGKRGCIRSCTPEVGVEDGFSSTEELQGMRASKNSKRWGRLSDSKTEGLSTRKMSRMTGRKK